MLYHLAVDASSASPDFVATILQWGPPGVVLALLLTGMLITRGNHEDVKAERTRWREAYEKECAAHATTREALVDSSKSSAAAVETAKTATALLSKLGHSTGDV